MEIREYDTSYECLNKHIMNNKNIYNIKRYPPFILIKYKDKLLKILQKMLALMLLD